MAAADTDLSLHNNNNPLPVRNEMVDTAIKFLENPNVINTPLAQKQKFLQRKGLTNEEIQLACEKSGAYSLHDQQQRAPPPLPQAHNLVPYSQYGQIQMSLFDRIRDIVHNVAIFSFVSYAIYKFYQKFIAPFLFGKKKKSVEESIEDLEKSVKKSVDELKDSLSSVKIEVDKITEGSDSSTHRQLADLKSDLATVKGLLLSRKQFPSLANSSVVPPSIPAWQMSSVSDTEQDGDPDRKAEDLLEVGSGSGSSEPEHCTKTSESSLEIIYSSRDCDSESCHSRKSKDEN